MSKDRRLGRGLAALLGTPLDEMDSVGMGSSDLQVADVAPRRSHRHARPGDVWRFRHPATAD